MYTILMYQIMLSLMLQQISLWNTSETYLTGNPNWMWLHQNSLKLCSSFSDKNYFLFFLAVLLAISLKIISTNGHLVSHWTKIGHGHANLLTFLVPRLFLNHFSLAPSKGFLCHQFVKCSQMSTVKKKGRGHS